MKSHHTTHYLIPVSYVSVAGYVTYWVWVGLWDCCWSGYGHVVRALGLSIGVQCGEQTGQQAQDVDDC